MPADADARRYRDIFEAAPDPILVHDPETGAVTDGNTAACELLDRDREELVGMEMGSYSPWEFTSADASAVIERALADGETSVDWAIRRPDGEHRWVEMTLTPATVDGEVRVVAFVRDVSERREREQTHAEWNEQLRAMVDNLPVVVFALDPAGTFTHSAGKGLESLGLEPGALDGMSVFDVYGDYPDIVGAADRALDGAEVRATQPVDDLVFETWYRPVFDGDELRQVVGVAREITELKRREERVDALSEATNDLLYTHTEAAVAERVTDIAERIIDRPIAAMWAYDADDDRLCPIGATTRATDFAGVDLPKELPEIVPGSDEKAIFDAGDPVVVDNYGELSDPSAPGMPLGTVLFLPLDDHGLFCVGSTVVEPFDEVERHLLDILSTTATAALDRVSRETELEDQRAALQRSNEALERRRDQMEFFNSILRHDILNGMNVIRARADLLADGLDGEEARYAETIVEWSDDITDLTRKVRSVLRTIADEGTAETEPVELAPLVESAANRAATMDTGAMVDVSVPEGVFVTADELLHDVFVNILTNAVEHGASEAEAVSVTVTTTTSDGRVTVRVADDGPGVEKPRRGEIFEHGQKGTDSGGTGFGLYFVDAMVESYGGQIQVEESDNGGAAFVIELPRAN